MSFYPRPEIALIILTPCLYPHRIHIRSTSLVAIIGTDFTIRWSLEPTITTAVVSVPAVVELAVAEVLQAICHDVGTCGEAKVLIVGVYALLIGETDVGAVVRDWPWVGNVGARVERVCWNGSSSGS